MFQDQVLEPVVGGPQTGFCEPFGKSGDFLVNHLATRLSRKDRRVSPGPCSERPKTRVEVRRQTRVGRDLLTRRAPTSSSSSKSGVEKSEVLFDACVVWRDPR